MTARRGRREQNPRPSRPSARPHDDPSEAERAEIKRAFLSLAMAHELKQPLNSMTLNCELLSKRIGGLPDSARPLAALGRAVDRFSEILDAWTERVSPEPVPELAIDLAQLAAAAVRRAEAQGLRIQLDVEAGLPPVPVHPAQVAVALDELIANAAAASPPDLPVTVAVGRDEDGVRIKVVDRGAGMEPDVAKRVFELGFSTRGAAGVGLTVAKFVAYHHAGVLRIVSQPGEGTTASLALPTA